MRNLRTLDKVEEEYLRKHPDEIDGYVAILFEEFALDNDIGALLASLRVVSRVKGVSEVAKDAGLSRKGLQKALSENGNPRFDSMAHIMQALGYRLSVQKIGG